MSPYLVDAIMIAFTIFLVFANGFFVAAEFALVKVRPLKLNEFVAEGRLFSLTAKWLFERLNASLSSCQLGITMASLGLGWIGEPALAHLIHPVLEGIGITSATILHTTAFCIAFLTITALHIVIGEQVPKIYGIRRPELVFLWCAVPLKLFYLVSYPFMIVLNSSANFVLSKVGIDGAGHHGDEHSEEEIRAMLIQAHATGELSKSEHNLLHAVFEFDDEICRRIMMPSVDVSFIDLDSSSTDTLNLIKKSTHTRFPLCQGSLDNVLGVVHLKDLIGLSFEEKVDLKAIARPPHMIPETTRLSALLSHFQTTRNHLAFVVDEHGSVIGIVTLEDVIENIVGRIDDEFDVSSPLISPNGKGSYTVLGSISLNKLDQRLNLCLKSSTVDTLSGFMVEKIGRLLKNGDTLKIDGVDLKVLEMRGNRGYRIGLTIDDQSSADDPIPPKT